MSSKSSKGKHGVVNQYTDILINIPPEALNNGNIYDFKKSKRNPSIGTRYKTPKVYTDAEMCKATARDFINKTQNFLNNHLRHDTDECIDMLNQNE